MPFSSNQDDVLSIDTPERVAVDYALAGIGSRAMAHIVDVLILLFTIVLLIYLYTFGATLHPEFEAAPKVTLILMSVGFFLLQWGYFLLQEALLNGQTLGKKICRVQVLMVDGMPVTFFAAAIRNLLRIVDFMPGGYAVGFVVMFTDSKHRRCGDFAAGTVVARLGGVTLSDVAGQITNLSNTETALSPLAARLKISIEEYNFISEFLARAETLPDNDRYFLSGDIAKPFLERGKILPGELAGLRPQTDRFEKFLRELAKYYVGTLKR